MIKQTIWLILFTLFTAVPWPAQAMPAAQTTACAQEITVQADDWLSKLADKYYGDPLAFAAIVAATNQQHAVDDSFAYIASPHVIEPGWKLCLPSPTDAAGLTAETTRTTYPLTLVDGLGRTVTLNAPPQRIVSLLPSTTEILFALGLGDRVVGVTEYDTYPPEVQQKDKIGGLTSDTISLEAIVALQPDLVLAHDELQQAVIDTLADNGLTVFALNTAGLADVYRAIDWVGQLADVQPQAIAMNQQIQADIAAVSAQIQQIPPADRPTVFFEVWAEPLMTAGPHTYLGQLITLAGGRNIFADVTQDYPEISPEVVISRNPAVILSSQYDAVNLTPEALAARPGWLEIEAAKTGRIYSLNDDLISRPGPRLPLALRELVTALYPDLPLEPVPAGAN